MAPGSRPAAAVHSQHAPTKRHLTLRAAWVDPRKASGYKHFLALAGVAQLARACACQAQGRRFDPGHPLSRSRGVRWLDQPLTPPHGVATEPALQRASDEGLP